MINTIRKHRWEFLGELVLKNCYGVIVEIGASRGDNVRNTRMWLKHFKYHFDKFYAIDPGSSEERYQPFADNFAFSEIHYINKTSDEALKDIFYQPDIVFVDGLHTAEQFTKDILNYSAIIKPGGIICGDDYNDHTSKEIKKAVEYTIGEDNLNLQLDARLEANKDNYLWWSYISYDQYGNVRFSREKIDAVYQKD